MPEQTVLIEGMWIQCDCDDKWCKLHEAHVFECSCPPIDDWTDVGLWPYGNLHPEHRIAMFIPTVPRPTARPRVLKTGRTYLPKPTKDAQAVVTQACKQAGDTYPYFDSSRALSVEIEALYPYPKSFPKRKQTRKQPMQVRPDLDNLAKTVLDAANGILWHDDAQITNLQVSKWRTLATPGWRVIVEATDASEVGTGTTVADGGADEDATRSES